MSKERPNGMVKITLLMLSAAALLLLSWSEAAAQHVSRTEDDDRAMHQFDYHLGEWGPPPEDKKNQGRSVVYAWELKGKTVRIAEYRTIDGKKTKVSDGLIGYHYGQKQILYQEFVLDGVNSFEVMHTGRYWFEDGNVMKREFTAFDPDTTSRTYRETFIPIDEQTRKLLIEYLADDGQWKKWGEFKAVRQPAQGSQKAERKELPTKYFEAFIGEWEPSEAEKKKHPNRRDFISAFEWDSRKRGVRILEGYSAGQKEQRILEGFALWNPVTGRVEFHAYNFEADFLFKGEYTLLEKDKLQRTYEVHYPNDHEFAKRGYPVIRFQETYTLREPDTMELSILYYNKKDNRWDPWGDNVNFVMVRRKAK